MYYVATASKPSSVTHSCMGNFTGPHDVNLIIAKCTRIEIYLFTAQSLQPILDVPIYGRIIMLQLCRPHGEHQDLLFIVTEEYKCCVLEWGPEANEIITRGMLDVSDQMDKPMSSGQICIIDPAARLIVLHLFRGLCKVIPFGNGVFSEACDIRLEQVKVLDIKFLFDCPNPTIAVLYKDGNYCTVDTYVVNVEQREFVKEEPRFAEYFMNDDDLLIPVPHPRSGLLVIGSHRITYLRDHDHTSIEIPIEPLVFFPMSITRAYGRFGADGSKYLLGGHHGQLFLLEIILVNEKVTELRLKLLGKTSIASTISYLDDVFVYLGSRYGDSQLLELNIQPENGLHIKIVESYVNLGPIFDFCVVDREKKGVNHIIACSGAYKDSSLRIIHNAIGTYDEVSAELPNIWGMWSLRRAIDDAYHTFLVVTFINETYAFEMNSEGELQETVKLGFSYELRTLFCHDAVHKQLVQVTSNSVRLVSSLSQKMVYEWVASYMHPIEVATANVREVLLAAGGLLIYLDIGDKVLNRLKDVQLDHNISCLAINEIDDLNHSGIAAVGTWMDTCVRIYSLPGLDLKMKVPFGDQVQPNPELIPRSLVICSFEGVSFLLCGLLDGHLVNYVLDMNSGQLKICGKVLLSSTRVIKLQTFASNNATHVFAACERPTIICSINKKLFYTNVNLEEVTCMCDFKSAAFPDRYAIARKDDLIIARLDDIATFHIRSIPLGEHARCICHQDETRTFAMCCSNYENDAQKYAEEHFVRLRDDRTFEVISSHKLHRYEYGCSIVSCSFSDDSNVYYCVGTGYVATFDDYGVIHTLIEPTEGRILVFIVKDGSLQLITQRALAAGAVCCLNAFKGKLLAAINREIVLIEWMLSGDGTCELLPIYRYDCGILPVCIQTHGDFIVVGDLIKSISLLIYKENVTKEQARDEYIRSINQHKDAVRRRVARDLYVKNINARRGVVIEEQACDPNQNWMTAIDIVDDNIYLGADKNFNLFTLRESREGADTDVRRSLEVCGRFNLREFVNQFRHGSLVMQLPDFFVPPIVIFGTVNGVIGIIASLRNDQYTFLERLQKTLRNVIKGVDGFSHEQWRSFHNEKKKVESQNFVDGDLIESFLDLTRDAQEDISGVMNVTVEEILGRVTELRRLH